MVKYRGEKPDRNYSVNDFYNKGIVVLWWARWTDYEGVKCLRIIFRSNGLLGEIRNTCGKGPTTYAVDVRDSWETSDCLTTECKNLKEAKSILYMWFKSKGFVVSNRVLQQDWRKNYLKMDDIQLSIWTNSNHCKSKHK